jgi:DNA-binding transcriptional ArsR family regulator
MKASKQTVPTSVELFKALSNPKRITILKYLHLCRFATNKVLAKATGVPQPQTTAAMKKLLVVKLVTKEKVGTQWIFELNQPVWKAVEHLL